MKKRLLYLDEADRVCPSAHQAMYQRIAEAKLPKRSWLLRMWWKVTGRGPRYQLLRSDKR